ncbi:HIRAN domain-containing protein, partial [Salinicoccus sp. YB14-2]|uniref:HIRAN domain-containing protein n=1 Tax=Salinicoccus sp. YB14-2 TaxID=1572701 RepID=UPI000AE56699
PVSPIEHPAQNSQNKKTLKFKQKQPSVQSSSHENRPASTFYVVGTRHYDLDEKVNEHIKSHKNKAYKSSRPIKEVVEYYGKIYKYSPMRSKKVEIISEPDNPHDRNALAVNFRGSKVGYIKAEETQLVNSLLENDKTPTVRIFGGPYKEFEDEFESNKLIEVENPFKIEVSFD